MKNAVRNLYFLRKVQDKIELVILVIGYNVMIKTKNTPPKEVPASKAINDVAHIKYQNGKVNR